MMRIPRVKTYVSGAVPAVMPQRLQIPPLRFASVGMTRGEGLLSGKPATWMDRAMSRYFAKTAGPWRLAVRVPRVKASVSRAVSAAVVIMAMLFCARAHAACGSITSGMTTSQLQTAISACSSGQTAVFPAGSWTITSTITVPNGVTMTGPVVGYSPIHNQTAVLGLGSGFAGPMFFGSSGSASQIWEYLECNGNEPSPNGGQCFYFPAGVSNVTVQNNYVHGNQGNTSGEYWNAGLIYFDGSSSSAVDSNIVVKNNIVGKNSYGDCSNIMQNYTYAGLGGDGGYCVGLGIHNGMNGLTVTNNIFQFMEQGMKIFEEQGECVNCVIEANDYNNIHRISFETQANIGGSQPTSMTIAFNSIHDQYYPNFGSWGLSAANGCGSGCNTATSDNVIINNVQAASAGGGYTPGAIEIWGSNPGSSTTQNYNLIQGYWANPLDYSSPGGFVSNNNTLCISGTVVASSPPPVGTAGGVYFANETENPMPEGPATATGSSLTNMPTCVQTSVAPTISPASGNISGTVTVTFTNPGGGRDANTGIWYTTDGSTPIPGLGSAQFNASGGTIAVTSPATVKAVGMWGAYNQPTSYTAGYGYLPSAVVTATYTSGAQYYLSPTGSDSNSGLSTSAAWLSPNHAVNCGDTITAAAGTYSSGNFQSGKWGMVTCSAGNNVAWLKCATFDACKVTATASDAMWVDQSYWGVQGWENSTNSTTDGACFHAGPSRGSTIHHIIFANDVANGCMGGGFNAYKASNTASVDYLAYIGNIAYAAAAGSGACYSGLNIYEPIASDSNAGTHLFVTGNFSYANVDGNPCAGTAPTDGEGVNLDTFDWSQGSGTPYTQQAVAENNIAVFNGGRGVYTENNAAGSTHATIYFKYNTMYANNEQLAQGYCSGNGDLADYNALNVTAEYNLVQTDQATMCTSAQAKYAMAVSTVNASVVFDYNYANGVSGNNTSLFDGGGFAFGVHNVIGTNPGYANAANPGAPNCGGKTNVPNCMATMVANFTPGSGVSSYGYQIPSTTSITDPLYPAWLCSVVLPAGLVTPGCGGTAPALTGGYQGNNGSVNTLAVGAPKVQQIAYGTYSNSTTSTLPDTYGNTPVWSSSNGVVLQVTSSGQVSCLTAGPANSQVVSSPGGVNLNIWGWTCTGTPPPTLQSVTLATTGGVSSINYQGTNQILATCHYSDGTMTSCNSADSHGNAVASWASSATAYVTISATGVGTGTAIGSSNLTAVVAGITSSPALALAVTSSNTLVSAYLSGASSCVTGATLQFAARCHYTTGTDQDCTVTDIYGDAVTGWNSSNSSLVSVENVGRANPGLAACVAVGSASITATINNTLASSASTVTVSSPSVTLTAVSLATTGGVTGLFVGSTNQLNATCTYSDGSSDPCTSTDVHGNVASTWTSTTPGHASVNAASGLATGVAPGATTITAKAGTLTSPAIPLTVMAIPSGVYTITITGPVKITGTVQF